MSRTSVTDRYDAVLDFAPLRAMPEVAYALVKQTYRIGDGRCELAEPQPLLHDLRDDSLEPRLPPGSDFWTQKQATDVVVQGSAFAPDGSKVREMLVGVGVGAAFKRVHVFGERVLEWRPDGTLVIPSPQPFTEIPLTYANAYGGIDPRLAMRPPRNPEELRDFDLFNYPGLYPRNLHGRGYLVERGPLPMFRLPNLERPDDLLTTARLITGDPALWHRQPLPWCFDWTNMVMFPRMLYMGQAPRFPPPADAVLPEVDAGILPADYASRYAMESDADPLPAELYQEASLGMTFKDFAPGTPLVLEGMHPERPRMAFRLPAPPSVDLFLEGVKLTAATTLTSCLITPSASQMCLVYVTQATELPRVFIPGVHKHIPFRAVIDGDRAIEYQAPTPALDRLEGRS